MYPNLDAELARLKKNRTDLAEILDLDPATISNKMTGKYDFKLVECKKIIFSLGLNCSIDYLFAINNEDSTSINE